MKTNNADKFTSTYMTYTDWQCKSCAHWSPKNATVCPAYPQGIPDAITSNKISHKLPIPGDNGIQWKAKS